MSGSGTEDGQARGLSPGEAFSALGNDIRVAILQTLWDAGEVVPYSELKASIGIDDSGRFNYHLEKLLGHFVERTERGYRLRAPGEQAVQAINADMFTGEPSFWPADMGVELADLEDAAIWTPTRHDPTAHFRRAGELAREGDDVRFLTFAVVSAASEAVQERAEQGDQTVTGVITAELFDAVREVPEIAQQTKDAIETGNATFYRYDGTVPYCLSLIDKRLAMIVKVDAEGTVRGHVESEDAAVVSWVASTIEEYRQHAEVLPADAFTT
jgi:hypothetical protein